MVTKSELKQILENDKQTSIGLGVPLHLFSTATEFIDWRGRFHAVINDNRYEMVVTPSTLFLNDPDPKAPILNMMGNSWVDTAMGQLYNASYYSSEINGGFQLFRKAGGGPFSGFEKEPHSHMLVYTNGNDEKTYVPVQISFSDK
jgi:hypothetical protein